MPGIPFIRNSPAQASPLEYRCSIFSVYLCIWEPTLCSYHTSQTGNHAVRWWESGYHSLTCSAVMGERAIILCAPLSPLTFQDIYFMFPNNQLVEHQEICIISSHQRFSLINIYTPPCSSCLRLYRTKFTNIFTDDTGDLFVMGDFNAHHDTWHSRPYNVASATRCVDLFGSLAPTPFHLCNINTPTGLPIKVSLTSQNISFISTHLALEPSKATIVSALHSKNTWVGKTQCFCYVWKRNLCWA